MSDVITYSPEDGFIGMEEDPEGGYVTLEDYKKLEDYLVGTRSVIKRLTTVDKHYLDQKRETGAELAEAKRRLSQITQCDNCGGSWLDDGINAKCLCYLRAELDLYKVANEELNEICGEQQAEIERLTKELEFAQIALAEHEGPEV